MALSTFSRWLITDNLLTLLSLPTSRKRSMVDREGQLDIPLRMLNKYWTIFSVTSPLAICLAIARKDSRADTSKLSVFDTKGARRTLDLEEVSARDMRDLRARSFASSWAIKLRSNWRLLRSDGTAKRTERVSYAGWIWEEPTIDDNLRITQKRSIECRIDFVLKCFQIDRTDDWIARFQRCFVGFCPCTKNVFRIGINTDRLSIDRATSMCRAEETKQEITFSSSYAFGSLVFHCRSNALIRPRWARSSSGVAFSKLTQRAGNEGT